MEAKDAPKGGVKHTQTKYSGLTSEDGQTYGTPDTSGKNGFIIYSGYKASGAQFENPDSAWERITIEHDGTIGQNATLEEIERNYSIAEANYEQSNEYATVSTTFGKYKQEFLVTGGQGTSVLVEYDNNKETIWNNSKLDKMRRVTVLGL